MRMLELSLQVVQNDFRFGSPCGAEMRGGLGRASLGNAPANVGMYFSSGYRFDLILRRRTSILFMKTIIWRVEGGGFSAGLGAGRRTSAR